METNSIGGLPFPLFRGKLEESWELHESNLRCWLSVQGIPFHSKQAANVLPLSLKCTAAQDYYQRSSCDDWNQVSFDYAVEQCRKIWVNQNLKRAQRYTFETELISRSYKQQGKTQETIKDLIDDVEYLFSRIGDLSDEEKRSHFINCFIEFPELCHALSFGDSYGEAVQEAVAFENMTTILKRNKAVSLHESRFPPGRQRPTATTQEEEEEHVSLRRQGFPVVSQEEVFEVDEAESKGGGGEGKKSRFVSPFVEETSITTLEEEAHTISSHSPDELQHQPQEPPQISSVTNFEIDSVNLDPPHLDHHHLLSPSQSTPPSNRRFPPPPHRQQLSHQFPRPPLPLSFHSPPPPPPPSHLHSLSPSTEPHSTSSIPERISTPNFIQEATNLSSTFTDTTSHHQQQEQEQLLYDEIQSPAENSFKSTPRHQYQRTGGEAVIVPPTIVTSKRTRSLLRKIPPSRTNHHSRSFSLPQPQLYDNSSDYSTARKEEEEEPRASQTSLNRSKFLFNSFLGSLKHPLHRHRRSVSASIAVLGEGDNVILEPKEEEEENGRTFFSNFSKREEIVNDSPSKEVQPFTTGVNGLPF
ncbi:hypothetical protein JCM3765_007365 [Sporobolomyces pararoseus]